MIGDTIDINHFIAVVSLNCDYDLLVTFANAAKVNGK